MLHAKFFSITSVCECVCDFKHSVKIFHTVGQQTKNFQKHLKCKCTLLHLICSHPMMSHFLLQGIFPTQGSNQHLWCLIWLADGYFLALAPSGKLPLAHTLLYLMCLHLIVSHNLLLQYVENASMPERGSLFLKTKDKFTNCFSCWPKPLKKT